MKTRKITEEHFGDLPDVDKLIKIFQKRHNDVHVVQVWFLKKKDHEDGFKKYHTDFPRNSFANVSYTINVNLGVVLEEGGEVASFEKKVEVAVEKKEEAAANKEKLVAP